MSPRRGRAVRLAAALAVTAVLAVALGAEAQPAGQARKMPRIGILSSLATDPEAIVSRLSTSLRPLGWGVPENVHVDMRGAAGDLSRLPRLAKQLVQLKPDVLVALWNSDVAALRHETKSIPIVMVFGVDPVGAGLVERLLRPGRNVTGVVFASPEIAKKELGLLKEVFPRAKRVGFVWNPALTSSRYRRVAENAADQLGLTVLSVEVQTPSDLGRALRELGSGRADSLYVDGLALSTPDERHQMLLFAGQRRLPAIYIGISLAERGGLMSYNPSIPDVWREAAGVVDAILRGAKPEQLPIRQVTKFELAVNLRTAKKLGLTIPASLARAADHVIE